jgi:hypothetical protein
MSYAIAAPEMMTAFASDLASIGSDISTAHAAAAVPTVALVPAAADEVSVGIAQLFSQHAEDFQGLAGKATVFHENFAQNLRTSAASYSSAEGAISSLLSSLFQVVGGLALGALIVGFFVVAVPIGLVGQMIEYFIARLGSLLP